MSEDWFEMATTAGEVNDGFGFMNFSLSAARPGTWTHVGAGSNLIYVDPANDLVIVCRWIRGGAFNQVVNTVLEAMGGS